jgi:hypothetical protein
VSGDDTKAPAHYQSTHCALGIAPGTEMIDWLVAMRGKEFAIDYMIAEIQCKANRLGLGTRDDHIAEDCFKIRQACRVVERLEGEE